MTHREHLKECWQDLKDKTENQTVLGYLRAFVFVVLASGGALTMAAAYFPQFVLKRCWAKIW
jgi:hypothetical protein